MTEGPVGSGGHGVRHEAADVNPRAVTRVGILVVAVAIVTSLLLLFLLRFLAAREARRDPPPPPLARHEPGRKPPEPRLQENPTLDVGRLRAEEEQVLTSYGWVDERAGVVRIPIDRAIELLAERGLPVFPARPSPPPQGAKK